MARTRKIGIGIDIGTNSIKLASNYTKKKSNKQAKLLRYDFLEEDDLTDVRDVNETHIMNGLRALLAEVPYRRADINVGLSVDYQNLFFLQLPQIPSHELKQALFWELAPLLSSPVDNYEFDYALLPASEKKKVNVLLAVIKQSRIEWLQKVFKSLSGNLNSLETTTLPTIDLFQRSHPKLSDTVGILHLGGSNSHYTIMDSSSYPEFLYLPFGGNVLNRIIGKSAGIPFIEVEQLRHGRLEMSSGNKTITTLYIENKIVGKRLKDLSLTIRKLNFRHFYKTGQKIIKLYVTGGLLNDSFIASFFSLSEEILDIPAELWEPIPDYYPDLKVDPSIAYQFSTAIALSLR